MKLLHPKNLTDFATGSTKLLPHDNDDMWNLYNIINIGDTVTSKLNYKFQSVAAVTGAVNSFRKTLNNVSILVEKLDWDGIQGIIRVSGSLLGEVENLHKGQHLTLQLEKDQPVTVEKDEWDTVSLTRLKEATDIFADAETVAVVMHHGLAHVCYVTRNMCPTIAKIEKSIPKKRAGPSGHDKAVENFYTDVANALMQVTNTIKCCVIASPGFIATEFYQFLLAKYSDKINFLSKVCITHAASGHKHALMQALRDPSLANKITRSSLVDEEEKFSEFLRLLDKDPDRAYYGYSHCHKAVFEHHAVQTLLIIDTLFKSEIESERRKYVQLVEQVKKDGGEVVVYSSQNPTGEQLNQVTGVVAILYYGIEAIDEEEEEERYMYTFTTVRDHLAQPPAAAANPAAAASSDTVKPADNTDVPEHSDPQDVPETPSHSDSSHEKKTEKSKDKKSSKKSSKKKSSKSQESAPEFI